MTRSDSETFWPGSRRKGVIRRRLLRWYDRHRRDLPWRRRSGNGYAQLLAEFMLQQTQVATVVDYYTRFIRRFPTIASLAEADLDEVLAMWSGLGYYRRARHLHAAARRIVTEHEGRVPEEIEALLSLPGVGRYTAGAVASIAYDARAPILDGNVARVLTRLLGIREDPQLPAVKTRLWTAAEELLPSTRCGDFNQALMELGATVCAPRGPSCLVCPLREQCRAHQEGLTDRIPPPARAARIQSATTVVAVLHRDDKLLFVQRPPTGLWAGLWELPGESVVDDEKLGAARDRLRKRLPAGVRLATEPMGQTTRRLTHRRITFHVYEGRVIRSDGRLRTIAGRPARWLAPDDLPGHGISRACEAILNLVSRSDES